MDVNTLRSVVTLLSFLAFAWIVWQAWRKSAQADHAAAAVLPFEDEPLLAVSKPSALPTGAVQ